MALSLLAAAQRRKRRSGSRRKASKMTLAKAKARHLHIYRGTAGGQYVLRGKKRTRTYL